MLSPLAGRFSGDAGEALNGLSCAWGKPGFGKHHPWDGAGRPTPLRTRGDAGEGEMGSKRRNGDSAGRLPLSEHPCRLFPRYAFLWCQSLAPSAEVTNLCPEPICSSPESYRLCHSQAGELLEEISLQALNYQPWPSVQGCFPFCMVSGNSAGICSACPRPRDPCETLGDSGAWREPAPCYGWLCLAVVGAVSRGRVSRGRGYAIHHTQR